MSKVVKTIGGALGLGGSEATRVYNPNQQAIEQADILKNRQFADSLKRSQSAITQAQQFGTGARQTQAQREQAALRGEQMGLTQALQAQMRGEGPSLARMQLQEATDRGLAQTAGMAASQRAVNPALAARNALQAQAQIQQEAGRDAAMIRAQEQLAAQQQLAQQLAQTRQQDQAVAQQQQAERAIALQAQQAQTGQTMSAADADRAARLALENIRAGQNVARMQQAGQQESNLLGALGGLGEGAAALAMFSDEDKKQAIRDADPKELTKFVEALAAKKYEYKDDMKEKAGEGEFVSPMAQDLEKTEIGKSMVVDTPEGKVVDYSKGFGVMLASQAVMNDRIKELEQALKMKKEQK